MRHSEVKLQMLHLETTKKQQFTTALNNCAAGDGDLGKVVKAFLHGFEMGELRHAGDKDMSAMYSSLVSFVKNTARDVGIEY